MSPLTVPAAEASALEKVYRRAVGQIRRERMGRTLTVGLALAGLGALGWAGWLWRSPEAAAAVPWGLAGAAGLLGLAVDLAFFWELERAAVWRRLDRELDLKDAVVTTTELDGETAEGWRERQRAQTLAALQRRTLAGGWPRLLPWAAGVLALGVSLLAWQYAARPQGVGASVQAQRAAQMAGVEAVFQDWEEAQKTLEDPELRKLLEELRPLREKLTAGRLEEKEAMLALSRVEEKLEQARRELEAKSLEGAAGEMAGAMEPLQNLSGLAAALRRRDFGKAEQLAGEGAEALARPEAKLPEGAREAANQQRMANVAKTMQERGQQAAGEALQNMAKGMKKGEAAKMGQGMKGLQQALGRQAARETEKKRLNLQLAQMGQCRECLAAGQCEKPGLSLLPQLALKKQKGGKGAGAATDPNRLGAETQLAAERQEQTLTGTMGEGDSETTTEKSGEAQREAPAGNRRAGFQRYQKLSQEAIEDESIPLAYRQTIRKYFELIRPTEK